MISRTSQYYALLYVGILVECSPVANPFVYAWRAHEYRVEYVATLRCKKAAATGAATTAGLTARRKTDTKLEHTSKF